MTSRYFPEAAKYLLYTCKVRSVNHTDFLVIELKSFIEKTLLGLHHCEELHCTLSKPFVCHLPLLNRNLFAIQTIQRSQLKDDKQLTVFQACHRIAVHGKITQILQRSQFRDLNVLLNDIKDIISQQPFYCKTF